MRQPYGPCQSCWPFKLTVAKHVNQAVAKHVNQAVASTSTRLDEGVNPSHKRQRKAQSAREGPDRKPRRDRSAGHPHLPRARHPDCGRLLRARSRRDACPDGGRGVRARRTHRRKRATSTPRRSSTQSDGAGPTGCIPATASSPRTPISPVPSAITGPSGSAPRRAPSRSWATRSARGRRRRPQAFAAYREAER